MSNFKKDIITDYGVCKFFIIGRCNRNDTCSWTHTKNQCKCGVYTNDKLCKKCSMQERRNKKIANDILLQSNGWPCCEKDCDGLSFRRNDYCSKCYNSIKNYIVNTCKQCNTKLYNGRKGLCNSCQF